MVCCPLRAPIVGSRAFAAGSGPGGKRGRVRCRGARQDATAATLFGNFGHKLRCNLMHATGDTVEPLPPCILSGCMMNANSNTFFGHQLIQFELFEQVNPIHHEGDLMHRQRELRIGVRGYFDRPVVRPE